MNSQDKDWDSYDDFSIGSTGVPLALTSEVHLRVFAKKMPVMKVAKALGISRKVMANMMRLLRDHGLPSVERLVVLSLNYPDRTCEMVANAFEISEQEVWSIANRAEEIRRREPLPSEQWEDIGDDDLSPAEVRYRAELVRRQHALEQEEVSLSSFASARRRKILGDPSPGGGSGRSPRPEGSQPACQPQGIALPEP